MPQDDLRGPHAHFSLPRSGGGADLVQLRMGKGKVVQGYLAYENAFP